MAKHVGWRKEPARHSLAAKGVKTASGNRGSTWGIIQTGRKGKWGSVEEINKIMREGKRWWSDYPEEVMERYLKQFKEPWKHGTLEFYRYGGKEYTIWTSLDGTKKAIMHAEKLYSDSDSHFATMETPLIVKHLTDAAEQLVKHGDFAKLMPTYALTERGAMMEELVRGRHMSEQKVYDLVDAEHARRAKSGGST